MHVLLVPALHASSKIVSPPAGLLPYWETGVSISGGGVIELHVQIFLQYHVRMVHAKHLFDGYHIIPFDIYSKGMIMHKVIF